MMIFLLITQSSSLSPFLLIADGSPRSCYSRTTHTPKEGPMARKISIGINWQGPLDYKALLEKVQIADAVGVHSAWVPEAWGRDAFTTLAVLADHTKNIQLGTAIVNTYSRT